MGTRIHNPAAPRFNNGVPLRADEYPHGLLHIPQVVLDMVAEEEAKFPPEIYTPEAKKRSITYKTLQYYFEDIDIAFRETSAGIEILAVGLEEIGNFVRNTPEEDQEDVWFIQP